MLDVRCTSLSFRGDWNTTLYVCDDLNRETRVLDLELPNAESRVLDVFRSVCLDRRKKDPSISLRFCGNLAKIRISARPKQEARIVAALVRASLSWSEGEASVK